MKHQDLDLVDLHCHILPGIDDGAADIDMSEQLLQKEAKDGVKQICFTPHFYPDKMSKDEFIFDRERAYRQVAPIAESCGIETAIGAEVHMTPELMNLSFDGLTYGNTNYLLLEWPFVGYPLWGNDIVYRMLDQGIRPVFAHIERYDYLFLNSDNLESYKKLGVAFQMNAGTLLRPEMCKQAISLIKKGYVNILSTDAHNPEERPPRLKHAFLEVESALGFDYAEYLTKNAEAIFKGDNVNTESPRRTFKLFFRR